jgi:predicted DNA-binding transcriptional regulator AlpA
MTHDTLEDDLGERLLSWPQVRRLTGLSRTTAWRLQKTGDFPRPVALSPHRVAWRESDLAAWRAGLTPARTRRRREPEQLTLRL